VEADGEAEAGGLRLHLADVVGDLGRALLRRRRHDEHGERERAAAAREQPLAGLDHGNKVADAPDGNQDDGRVGARHAVVVFGSDSGWNGRKDDERGADGE